ncbi:1-deoxy-D-xylulose 5-phosphate reductoisomerase [Georgenia satyanarayanai]|uniref:1-deoxy-D-xylulose 5-phosphate reductoisomerase n=1 Tax=Georgenia satyanarayanai TaxID=860221 RepID=A0A2Y9AH86_9MICO|nr:1-deoxy-D-xylulose-5-phosphate reductoisomerase [Georgenia satyanarayanai]PYF99899.1 1-deoxy-D-xylulose 5-phosphate reductoisomerase [Georgenia satyanarayanai]SSA41899.1 1-deoxy-D-xylulose 5-phosphate reductoisomerase [Georgenia satyanarayanai]
MTTLTLLGSTGSIGTQALEVVSRGGYEVAALAAGGGNVRLLAEQVLDHDVPLVAVSRGSAADVRDAVAAVAAERGVPAPGIEVLVGEGAAAELAGAGSDVVLNGVTGSVGLAPTLAALRAGSSLALANKESLVVGGALVRAARQRPDQIVPVDSEHSAMAQALRSGTHGEVARLVLTASGGPFRGKRREELTGVTAAQALAHPTWAMGPVVTVNSATLVNKGLELIEAHLLFDVAVEDITVVVHPQSIVHSMVEFVDGSTIAQASPPDMRLPIALALSWPARPQRAVAPCRWDQATSWTFEPLDEDTFRGVRLARQAAAASATHPAVLNAANEECVAAFLDGRLAFLAITDILEQVLAEHDGVAAESLDLATVHDAEAWARRRARELAGAR